MSNGNDADVCDECLIDDAIDGDLELCSCGMWLCANCHELHESYVVHKAVHEQD